MDDRLDDLFQQLKNVSPPEGLEDKIFTAVEGAARRQRLVTVIAYGGLVVALAGVLASGRLLVEYLRASPVPDLIRLAASDSRQVLENFSSWFLAVIEGLPMGALVLVMGAIFVAAALMKWIAERGRQEMLAARRLRYR